MSFNTTPLFGRNSVAINDGETEQIISPTKPLDLRASIVKAQQSSSSSSPQAIRLSTIAQRLTTDRTNHFSVQSVNTYTSSDTFLTANSQEYKSQHDLYSQTSHPFMPLTKSRDQLLDLDATPIVKESKYIDITTPKAEALIAPPDETIIKFEEQPSGLGIVNTNKKINSSGKIAYDEMTEDIATSPDAEFTFDSYNNSNLNGTLLSGDDTVLTISSHKQEDQQDDQSRRAIEKKPPELNLPDENLAYLFIIAVHSFNVSSLENEEDAAICISFEKDDIAFVHTVDESGWGEVTLIKNMQKGWVPFNYFADVVKQERPDKNKQSLERYIETRKPLEKLLSACAKFILHPQDYRIEGQKERSFQIEYINSIREGVKSLLQDTNCVSRSNPFVQKKPIIKKMRKRLLAEWYNLMIKADSYKHTTDVTKVKTLITMTFSVLRKAFLFYEIWWVERLSYEIETKKSILTPNRLNGHPLSERHPFTDEAQMKMKSSNRKPILYLKSPPAAVSRLKEIHDILFSYFGLILGRLDMIEHNPASCEVLESIVHQIILLLRELLYISQACSSVIHEQYNNQYENSLDYNLDPLLSLVSELVSSVKVFVTQTIQEKFDETNQLLIKDDLYYYTDEGEHMILIISQMTRLISNAISGCNNYLKLIGDFRLSDEREYPDFTATYISPKQFIRKCSSNLLKRMAKDNQFYKLLKKNESTLTQSPSFSRNLARFSTIRSGKHENAISTNGTQLLIDYLPDKKSFFRDSQLESFKVEQDDQDNQNQINNREKMENELQFDKYGALIGVSFRALVFIVTDEMRKNDDFLLYTFLLNYNSFGKSAELLEHLIARFDAGDQSSKYSMGETNGKFSSLASRLRKRRRLTCKVIQTWMESFWDYQNDYTLVSTLINFFNEEVSELLPIESKTLMEIAARIAAFTPKEMKKNNLKIEQLVPVAITSSQRPTSIISISSSHASSQSSTTVSLSVDEQFIEKYELTKLPQSSHSTISLPVPILSLGNFSLLTKRNIADIERIVLGYRDMVGFPNGALNTRIFIHNFNLERLIDEWMRLVDNSKKQIPPRNFIHNDVNLCELNPLEVSKQLSLLESTMFMRISAEELVNGKLSSKKSTLVQSPNVKIIMTSTNLLSNYVLESILSPSLTMKKRINRVKSWLRIALSCLYFRNFNSLASIMTTLQSYVISRLSIIWNSLENNDVELYEYLSKIIHPNNNYKVYRNKLKKLMEENTTSSEANYSKSLLPVVPFFNLFLQDLTFIEEGNPNFRNPDSFRPNKLINIDKYLKVTKTIAMLQFFQVGYETNSKSMPSKKRDSFFSLTGTMDIDSKSIKPVQELQEFILFEFWRVNTLFIDDTDRGYTLSLQLVPRN